MTHLMETLRRIGFSLNCREARVFYDLCYDRIKVQELTSEQIEDVLYIFETRNRLPRNNVNYEKSVSYVRPTRMKGETDENFNKRYITKMLEFINNPEAEEWKTPKT